MHYLDGPLGLRAYACQTIPVAANYIYKHKRVFLFVWFLVLYTLVLIILGISELKPVGKGVSETIIEFG